MYDKATGSLDMIDDVTAVKARQEGKSLETCSRLFEYPETSGSSEEQRRVNNTTTQ